LTGEHLFDTVSRQEGVMRKIWIAGIMVAASLFVGAHAVSAGQSHAAASISYEVRTGDTLWTIASKLEPGKDRREVVYDLIQANRLGSPTILPGQILHLSPR
jgi:LysM repeat protein